MQNNSIRTLRHNFSVNVLEGGVWGLAIGFASFSTIIPLFVSHLTNSAILIGLIPALQGIGWQLPQLFTARYISRLNKVKPFVLWMTIHERLPFLGLAIVAFFLPSIGLQWALVITFALLIWQGMGSGFTANAWQNLICRIIPSDYRATFFGSQAAAVSLFATPTAIIAGFILESHTVQQGFALNFLLAAVLVAISMLFLATTREPDQAVEPVFEEQPPLWNSSFAILKKDKPFVWFLISRATSQFATMAFGFYAVYAVQYLGMSEATAGVMTSILLITQVIANPLSGWFADRWNRKWILEIGTVCTTLSALIAYLASNLNWFYIVFIFTGIASTTVWTVSLALVLDYGTAEERPTYVGLAYTLTAPSTLLAQILGGLIADATGYTSAFLISVVAGLITLFIYQFFITDPRTRTSMG